MSVVTCTNCGRITNSATSNYWLDTEIDGKTKKKRCVATKCYAALVDEDWVKGCAYDHVDPIKKRTMDKLISSKGV